MFTSVRLAYRTTFRWPTMAAVVVPIALSIAITSALFSIVDGLLFRPLPLSQPDELVAVRYRLIGGLPPEIAYLPSRATDREALVARIEGTPLVRTAAHAGPFLGFGEAARDLGLEATAVDVRFFRLLGLVPRVGAEFRPEDELSVAEESSASGTPLPVIISDGLARGTSGADASALGVRELAGRRVRVVGVMDRGVKFPGETAVWVLRRFPQRVPAYARLAVGASVSQLAAAFPALEITSVADAVRPGGTGALFVLFGAAALLLLVAWVQVAALMISSLVGRVHEIGVRLALGAGHWRLISQFATENAFVAGSAFALAWPLAPGLTRFIVSTLPPELSRGQYLSPDARTLAFAGAVSLVGLGLLTMLPLGMIRRTPLVQQINGRFGGRLGQLPLTAERLRHALLVGQVAITAVLLYLSGLTVHSFLRAATFDYGFDANRVLLFKPPLRALDVETDLSKYADRRDPEFDARYDDLRRRAALSVERLERTPGVVAAATLSHVPLVDPVNVQGSWDAITEQNGRPLSPRLPAYENVVSRNFVRALGAHLVAGQSFDAPEFSGMRNIVVVNETLANQLAPPVNIMGTNLRIGLFGSEIRTRTGFKGRIIGVIQDLVIAGPTKLAVPQYFWPSDRGEASHLIAIRASPSVEAASPAIRGVLREVWGDLPPRNFSLLKDAWETTLTPYRTLAVLLSVIAWLCLPLAAVGITGALLYSVRVRARETAIRIALGADPVRVGRGIIKRALLTVAAALLLGVAVGAAAGRVMAHYLFQVSPADPWTIIAVAAVLVGIAWLAAWVPARLASHIDPATALREA